MFRRLSGRWEKLRRSGGPRVSGKRRRPDCFIWQRTGVPLSRIQRHLHTGAAAATSRLLCAAAREAAAMARRLRKQPGMPAGSHSFDRFVRSLRRSPPRKRGRAENSRARPKELSHLRKGDGRGQSPGVDQAGAGSGIIGTKETKGLQVLRT